MNMPCPGHWHCCCSCLKVNSAAILDIVIRSESAWQALAALCIHIEGDSFSNDVEEEAYATAYEREELMSMIASFSGDWMSADAQLIEIMDLAIQTSSMDTAVVSLDMTLVTA